MHFEPDDVENTVRDWFIKTIAASGWKNTQIAELLNLPKSAISKMKNGQQSLKASHLLILASKFGAELPKLTQGIEVEHQSAYNNGGTSKLTEGSYQADDYKALFDLAYDRIINREKEKPEALRMNKYELLDTVFHMLKKLELPEKN